MNLVVNGENLKIDECSNVQDLITKLGYQDQRIALEVNEASFLSQNILNLA